MGSWEKEVGEVLKYWGDGGMGCWGFGFIDN